MTTTYKTDAAERAAGGSVVERIKAATRAKKARTERAERFLRQVREARYGKKPTSTHQPQQVNITPDTFPEERTRFGRESVYRPPEVMPEPEAATEQTVQVYATQPSAPTMATAKLPPTEQPWYEDPWGAYKRTYTRGYGATQNLVDKIAPSPGGFTKSTPRDMTNVDVAVATAKRLGVSAAAGVLTAPAGIPLFVADMLTQPKQVAKGLYTEFGRDPAWVAGYLAGPAIFGRSLPRGGKAPITTSLKASRVARAAERAAVKVEKAGTATDIMQVKAKLWAKGRRIDEPIGVNLRALNKMLGMERSAVKKQKATGTSAKKQPTKPSDYYEQAYKTFETKEGRKPTFREKWSIRDRVVQNLIGSGRAVRVQQKGNPVLLLLQKTSQKQKLRARNTQQRQRARLLTRQERRLERLSHQMVGVRARQVQAQRVGFASALTASTIAASLVGSRTVARQGRRQEMRQGQSQGIITTLIGETATAQAQLATTRQDTRMRTPVRTPTKPTPPLKVPPALRLPSGGDKKKRRTKKKGKLPPLKYSEKVHPTLTPKQVSALLIGGGL